LVGFSAESFDGRVERPGCFCFEIPSSVSRYFGVGANCGITVVLRGTLDSRFSKSAGTLFRTGP
jgi:hypothetical protein